MTGTEASGPAVAESGSSSLYAGLLGCEIRRRRLAAGLTLTGLAGRAGLSASYLSELERGKKSASLTTMDQVAKALGVSCAALLPPAGLTLGAPGLPARLREVREGLNLTQESLARRAGVSPSLVAQIEAGKAQPSLTTLRSLAVAMGVSPCYLLIDNIDMLRVVAGLPATVQRLLTDPECAELLAAVAALDSEGRRRLGRTLTQQEQ